MCHRYGLGVGSCIRPKDPFASDGERNFKLTSPRISMSQNAFTFNTVQSVPPLVYPTLYASPLITLTKHGYTKHYFEGMNRICSKLGGGFDAGLLGEIEDTVPALACDYVQQSKRQHEGANRTFSECLGMGAEVDGKYDLYKVVVRETERDKAEPAFYYHSDHLGSAAYLTNDDGKVTQTLNYLPYGEDWVDVRNDFDPRIGHYTFNGKEKDYESGFHYYGARYYWSELLTGWLSVDPMMDKYPGISPYAYCAWNPIKLIDPDGREIDDYKLNTKTGSLILTKKTRDNFDMIIPDDNNIDAKIVSKGILNGKNIGDDVSKTGFAAADGKQAEGVAVMVYISFSSHRELSAWGYDDNKGKNCLDIAPWNKNTSIRSWSYFTSGEYDKRGTRRFHVHTHPGTEDGKGGFAKPSPTDIDRAKNFISDYYIISRKQGLSQYNSTGKHWEPLENKTPTSLLPYRIHK